MKRTGHDVIGIGVFLLEIRDNVGIFARVVAKPVVVVDANVAEHVHVVLHLVRHRRGRWRLRVHSEGREQQGALKLRVGGVGNANWELEGGSEE